MLDMGGTASARFLSSGNAALNQFQTGFQNALDTSPVGAAARAAGQQGFAALDEVAAFAGVGLEDGEGGQKLVRLPGVGVKAKCDDEGATLVFVLPKVPYVSDEEGGGMCGGGDEKSSDEDEHQTLTEISEPFESAKKVFKYEQDFMKKQLTTSGTAYQRLARQALSDVITKKCGLHLSSFPSTDGNSVFWKVCASKAQTQNLAEKYNYALPHSEKAYESVDMQPPMVGDLPMYAYGRFEKAHADDFDDFRSMDEVRLLVLELETQVSFHELKAQGIIERWFPAAKHEEMQELAAQVVGWPFGKFSILPQENDADRMQSYFGEEVAVFFSFYGSFISGKRVPAIAAFFAIICYLTRPFGLSLCWIQSLYAAYGCLVIVWGAVFISYAEHVVLRDRVRWGSDEQKRAEVQMGDYQPKLRGTNSQKVVSAVGKLVTGAFLILVMGTCSFLSLNIKDRKLSTMVQTGVTFLFSFLWGKVAKTIVTFENKRTQERFNQSLTMRLFFVKMFIFFFPLVRLAFIAPVAGRVCEKNIEDAAPKFFNETANNLADLGIKSPTDEKFLRWMNTSEWIQPNKFVNYLLLQLSDYEPEKLIQQHVDQLHEHLNGDDDDDDDEQGATKANTTMTKQPNQCFRGCFPVKCEIDKDHGLHCQTTCFMGLQRSLNLLYITHVVCSLLFVVVPMVQVRRAAKKEIAQGKKNNRFSDDGAYSLLEYQEKCSKEASYEYESWGGSPVEDLLEVVLGFSVLVSFSIVSPYMAIIGLFAQVMEYRLLAFRMTWVTCRPYPAGSEGLREWLHILDVILYVAIGMNSLLLISVMRTHLDEVSIMTKLIVILAITLALIAIKVLVRISLVEHPTEYIEAMDQNHEFVEALDKQRKPFEATKQGNVGSANVEIGVHGQ